MTEYNSESFFDKIGNSFSAEISSDAVLSNSLIISFENSSGKKFSFEILELYKFLKLFRDKNAEVKNGIISHVLYVEKGSPWIFQEKPYRSLADKLFPISHFPTINALIRSQTNGFFNAVNAFICFLNDDEFVKNEFKFDDKSLEIFLSKSSIYKKHLLSEGSEKIKLNQRIFGPEKYLKDIALKCLKYCYEHYHGKFLELLDVDEYRIKISGSGPYLWASQMGFEKKNLDKRVFLENPFAFNDIEYYLSDQWTFDSKHGRSIKQLNAFVEQFGLSIEKEENGLFVCQHNDVDSFSDNLAPIGVDLNLFRLIPKSFLLLAGISGTGKTRFVREQAKLSSAQFGVATGTNYCLVPVRPDWHEPSDLLGYISRIDQRGPRYVVTDLLRFIVSAWKVVANSATDEKIVCKSPAEMCPFWLCLDEMNLAPVEQYFADYLSILETRKWEDGVYSCEPLLKSTIIRNLDEDGRTALWKGLGLDDEDDISADLRTHFSAKNRGISLPPNLMVAGTVNMDETTHGFSRKVIDRALTIDFGEFYPNDYSQFYAPTLKAKPLSFPTISQVKEADLATVDVDNDGAKTINFLSEINSVLTATPFELAYRALNEALLAVVCFKPTSDEELQAVWDDFLMMKVIPRIEGDAEKLEYDDENSLLLRLSDELKKQLATIWDTERPDLLRETLEGGATVLPSCRSKKKLDWMQQRLSNNGFTTFWP